MAEGHRGRKKRGGKRTFTQQGRPTEQWVKTALACDTSVLDPAAGQAGCNDLQIGRRAFRSPTFASAPRQI